MRFSEEQPRSMITRDDGADGREKEKDKPDPRSLPLPFVRRVLQQDSVLQPVELTKDDFGPEDFQARWWPVLGN